MKQKLAHCLGLTSAYGMDGAIEALLTGNALAGFLQVNANGTCFIVDETHLIADVDTKVSRWDVRYTDMHVNSTAVRLVSRTIGLFKQMLFLLKGLRVTPVQSQTLYDRRIPVLDGNCFVEVL